MTPPMPDSPAPTPLPEFLVLLRSLVDEQANDDGLWFIARTASEAYLQRALRDLHAAVEAATND